MSAEHVPGNGLLTPGIAEGGTSKHKASMTSRKSTDKKSPPSSHTLGGSPGSMNGSDRSPGDSTENAATAPTAKPKRVRTG
jgi:hypothetical protein